MAGWDDDNFEPQGLTGGGLSNKWEGEDEEDEVKENWEDEDEEKKVEEKKVEEVVEAKPKLNKKKIFQEKLQEKERMHREAQEKPMKEFEEEISPEEQLRRQKESDLKAALETTFSSDKLGDGTPSNKEDFQELANTITKNIQQFSKSDEYPTFTENIIRGICTTLNVYDLKKIKTTIDNMVLEKQKLEKGDKPKKNKGKGKAKLNIESDSNYNQYSAFVDDFDDFAEYI